MFCYRLSERLKVLISPQIYIAESFFINKNYLSIEYAFRLMSNRQIKSDFNIIWTIFFIFTVTIREPKLQITKRLISNYLKNLLPYQLYDMQIIQSIRIDPWNVYIIPRYFYRIWNSYNSAAFDVFVSLFPFFNKVSRKSFHPVIPLLE